MTSLWSAEARYERWLQVELAALDAMAARGDVPAADARQVREKAPRSISSARDASRWG